MKLIAAFLVASLLSIGGTVLFMVDSVSSATGLHGSPPHAALLRKVNALRSRGCKCGGTRMKPVAPLKWSNDLEDAARAHSRDMSKNDFFNHQSSDGSSLAERINRTGYKWSAIGENIAFGQRDEAEVFEAWLKSPGHCRNMMNASFKEMGAAKVGIYWTQDFAASRP